MPRAAVPSETTWGDVVIPQVQQFQRKALGLQEELAVGVVQAHSYFFEEGGALVAQAPLGLDG